MPQHVLQLTYAERGPADAGSILPLQEFVRAVERAGLSDRVRYLGRGERHEFAVPPRREGPAVATRTPTPPAEAWMPAGAEPDPRG